MPLPSPLRHESITLPAISLMLGIVLYFATSYAVIEPRGSMYITYDVTSSRYGIQRDDNGSSMDDEWVEDARFQPDHLVQRRNLSQYYGRALFFILFGWLVASQMTSWHRAIPTAAAVVLCGWVALRESWEVDWGWIDVMPAIAGAASWCAVQSWILAARGYRMRPRNEQRDTSEQSKGGELRQG